jgi:hypothetical protein
LNLQPIGSRVRVRETVGVAAYLHGATGSVIEHRFSKIDQKDHVVVKLDEPRAPTPTWTPLEQIGLSPAEVELL